MPNFAPIKLNEISPKVADLQSLLQIALPSSFELHPNELSQQLAGESTRQGLLDLMSNLGQNIAIPATGNLLKPDIINILDNLVVLNGTVITQDNKPFPNQTYQAYNVTFAGMGILDGLDTRIKIEAKPDDFFPIGNVSSKADDSGQFKVVFSKAESKENVVVFAFDDNGAVIGKSKLATKSDLFDKLEFPNFNLVLNSGIIAPEIKIETEFDLIKNQIIKFASNQRIDLPNIQSDEQWNYLTQETGIEADKVQLFRKANSFGDTKAELLYGMGRTGISIDHSGIAFSNNTSQQEAIDKAVKDGLISKPADNHQEILTGLNTEAYKKILMPEPNKPSQIGQLLGLSLNNEDAKVKFLEVYTETQYNPAAMWEKLSETEGIKENVPAIKVASEVFSATGANIDLTTKLIKDKKVSDVRTVMGMDLQTMEFVLPENVKPEEKAGYVKGIQDGLTEKFPTKRYELDYLKFQKPNDTVSVGNHVKLLLSTDKFDFKVTNLNALQAIVAELKDEQGVLLPEIDRKNVEKKLATSQRLFQISPNYDIFEKLHITDLKSALDVSSFSETRFIKTHSAIFGEGPEGEILAQQVYTNAKTATARAETAILAFHDTISAEKMAALAGMDKSPKPSVVADNPDYKNLITHLPDFEEFFGANSNCECKDCQSIYSPAAYLVDTLQFLKNGESKTLIEPQKNPLAELNDRRPDIFNIPFTCENTNTIIPYIDLVNEVMEYFIVDGKLDSAPSDTKNAKANELRADAQNTREEAYNELQLAGALYPFNLPYHRPLDQIRSYLPQLKTSRLELLDIFGNESTKELAMIKEYFGMSDIEYSIIIDQDFSNITKYFGTTVADLGTVKTFLDKTKIHFTDLLELVSTKFLNPESKILIIKNVECNLEKMLFAIDAAEFSTFLIQIKTFIRIWRKTNVTIHELDVLLSAIKIDGEIEKTIKNLYYSLKTNETLQLSIPKLACIWGNIDTYGGDKSLYNKMFQNRFVKKIDVLKDFELLPKSELKSGLLFKNDNLKIISIAFQIDLAQLIIILKDINYEEATTNISLSNLSLIYRYILLAKNLKINIQDLIIYKGILGLNIISKDPTDLENFITTFNEIKEIGFTTAQIQQIFGSSLPKPETIVIFNEKLLKAIKACRDGFAQIDLENPDVNTTDSNIKGTIRSTEINAEFLANKLAMLFGNDIAQKFVGLFNGNTIFSIKDAPNLIITIDPSLKNKLFYDKTTGILSIKGIIKEAEKDKVVGFNSVVVDNLFEKFKSFIIENAISNLFPNEAERNLLLDLDGITSTEPYISIYEKLIPLLRENLKDLLVSSIYGNLIEIDIPTTSLLLKDDFENLIKKSNTTGLSSGGITVEQIDENVTIGNFTWSGYICSPITDDITFILEAPNSDQVLSFRIDGVKAEDTLGSNSQIINYKIEAGKFYTLSITNKIVGYNGGVNFYWKSKTIQKATVPTDVLQPDFAFIEIKNRIENIQKKAEIIKTFKLTFDEVNYWLNSSEKIGFNNVKDINTLYKFTSFRKHLPQNPITIATFSAIADQLQPENKNLILSQITNWDIKWIEELAISDYSLGKLSDLHKHWTICKKTKQTVKTLSSWIDDITFDDLNKTAQEIINLVKVTYDDPDLWLEFAPILNNPIRERQRDALIAFLLQVPKIQAGNITDADGLYEYFLIDVQMGAKMDTSRIKQAISAVQLFVQRILLNLEPNVLPSLIDTTNKRWEWQKHYRLWEANRKIFMYPENWLEPEYRDNKSPFFKELESDLLQNDITDENVEKALREYVYKLNEVAHLDICGVHQEDIFSTPDKEDYRGKIHVVARTHAAPYQYFYRTTSYPILDWTAWDKVPVDIKGVEDGENSGVHLLPVVFEGRTYLFWPEFMEKIDEKDVNMTIPPVGSPHTFVKPQKYWEVRLAWSSIKDNKWLPKQISKEFIELNVEFPLSEHTIIINVKDNLLNFRIFNKIIQANTYDNTGFNFNGLQFREEIEEPLFPYYNDHDKITFQSLKVEEFKTKSFINNKLIFNKKVNIKLTSQNNINSTDEDLFRPNEDYVKNFLFLIENQRVFFAKPENIFRGFNNIDYKFGTFTNPKFGYIITRVTFHNFYHPFTPNFIKAINQKGIDGIMSEDTNIIHYQDELQYKNDKKQSEFYTLYEPDSDFVDQNYPLKNIDFSQNGGYSLYNWELFFHAPLFIANRLSKNGKYKEAMRWFHYIFDPTTNEPPNPADATDVKRFWKVKGFRDIDNPKESIEAFFIRIANKDTEAKGEVTQWLQNPFNAHSVARNRNALPYMKNVMFQYIENLYSWGDDLFRQESMESINKATQLYVMAGHLLGKRPEFIPKLTDVTPKSYNIIDSEIDTSGNFFDTFQNLYPAIATEGAMNIVDETATGSASPIGKTMYFGIPFNKKILTHWDTVKSRLFNIRHSLGIEGNELNLDLFGSEIDPGMLASAVGKGLSLSDILSDLNTPAPMYRFSYLMQKAVEFTGEVKVLGGAILAAIEKGDSEKLSLMRASHESTMINLVTGIKERQVLEAKANRQNLEVTRKNTKKRISHYMGLMGIAEADYTIPDLVSLSADLNADSTLPADTIVKEEPLKVNVSLSNSKETGVMLIPREADELQSLYRAKVLQSDASAYELLASIYGMFPNFAIDAKPIGVGGGATFGGSNFAAIYSAAARIANITAANHSYNANNAAKMASYIRRVQDWTFQLNSAAREIVQVDKQIVAADIRIQIAQKELSNHLQQIKNTEEVEAYLKDKFTNQELYTWMKEQLMSIYKLSYQMAYDLAKKTEKAYRFEIGKQQSDFIKYGYFDSNFKGLLAGEKLHFALKQLEKAYMDENVRRLELTKHISLRNINPKALLDLIKDGNCEFELEEWLFDLDFAGHYFRTIKSVSLSIPCVAGPYTTINCSLRLQKNSIRINTTGSSSYLRNIDGDNDRFIENSIPFKSIVTSSAQNDSGMFEVNFRDERYLPFEGSGAISKWQLELGPVELQQFDYNSIADVVMHVKYTAREEGGDFKKNVISSIDNQIKGKPIRMFNVKQDFPNEWHTYKNNEAGGLKFTIIAEHLPFWAKGKILNIEAHLHLFDEMGEHESAVTIDTNHKVSITKVQLLDNENPFLILKIK
ncbi:MAG: neuraminidase-like domain-containing protein [Bacteroidota bacterium]